MLIKIASPLLLLLVLVTACATTPSGRSESDSSSASAPTAVYVTGSRIPTYVPDTSSSRAAVQAAQPTQTIGSRDIALSGQTDTSQALRMLVPSQQVAISQMGGGR